MTHLGALHSYLDEEELGKKHVGVLHSHSEGEEELGMKHVGVLRSHLEGEEELGMKQVGVLRSHLEGELGTRFPGFLG